jgi:hypothetical protein
VILVADGKEESVFPWGGIIGPVIGGVILILVGLSSLFGWNIWEYFWEFLVIIIGIIIIIGAIYRARK